LATIQSGEGNMNFCTRCGKEFMRGEKKRYFCFDCKPEKKRMSCKYCSGEIKEGDKFIEEKPVQVGDSYKRWHIGCKYRQIRDDGKDTLRNIKEYIKDEYDTIKQANKDIADYEKQTISTKGKTQKELTKLKNKYPEECKIAEQEEVEEGI
jgi:hypothetical protein